MNNLQDKFGNIMLEKRTCMTSESPRFKVIHPDQDMELINPELQSRYCSGVGMILHITGYSKPNICDVVRELCKCIMV
jgi:hypothetical protein